MKLYNTDEAGNLVEVEAIPQEEFDKKVAEQIKEKEETWKKEKEELEAGVNPNWKEYRLNEKRMKEQIARMEALQNKGKTINENGEIEEYKKEVSPIDVQTVAEQIAEKKIREYHQQNKINEYLREVPQDKRESFKKFFDKISAGEQLDDAKIDSYMEMSKNVLGISRQRSSRNVANMAGSGSSMRNMIDSNDFSETEEGKNLANLMGIQLK